MNLHSKLLFFSAGFFMYGIKMNRVVGFGLRFQQYVQYRVFLNKIASLNGADPNQTLLFTFGD